MPRFNIFRSRKEAPPNVPINDSQLGWEGSEADYVEDVEPIQHARPHSPSFLRNLLSRNHPNHASQLGVDRDQEEPWELLEASEIAREGPKQYYHQHRPRPTVEDYYSDEERSPSRATDDVAFSISESSGHESPIPIVQRQEDPDSLHGHFYEDLPAPSLHSTHSSRHGNRRRDATVQDGHIVPPPPIIDGMTAHPRRRRHRAPAHEWHMHADRHRTKFDHTHTPPPLPRSQSPVSSITSTSVVHTLDDGTRIEIPASQYDDAGHPITSRHRAVKPDERTFYIIPPGMNVIFQDERGNELRRIGDFSNRMPNPMIKYEEAPIVLKDEHGRVLYRTGAMDDTSTDASDDTYGRPNIVHLGQFMAQE
ncbi:hypothetical protein DENSPDRAFT_17157 [Dentipellis sp. KUC8613]|nr:hypothetical protein DENSPDRAFT_17157 [Dentipellis sp. KUC8613]